LQDESRSNKPFTILFVEKALGGCQTADTKQIEKPKSLKKRGKTCEAKRAGRLLIYFCIMKTTKFLNLAAAGVMAAAVGFAGCDPKQTDPVLAVNPDAIEATADARTDTVEVTSTAAWSSEVDAEWCTVSPNSFAGSKAITVSVATNWAYEARSATITFTSGTLKKSLVVKQDAAIERTCTVLVVDPDASKYRSVVYPGTYYESKVPVYNGQDVVGADAETGTGGTTTDPTGEFPVVTGKGGKYQVVCR
jgi:hypothetical protein